MSYYISVSAKKLRDRDLMIEFLNSHEATWAEVTATVGEGIDPDYDCTWKCHLGSELSKSLKKAHFGYHYNAGAMGNGSRWWAYQLLQFAALQVGRAYVCKGPLGKTKAPCILYDGYEKIPILLRPEWKDRVAASGTSDEEKEGALRSMVEWSGFRTPDVTFGLRHLSPEVTGAGREKLIELSELWEASISGV